jgi:hypothetical protein
MMLKPQPIAVKWGCNNSPTRFAPKSPLEHRTYRDQSGDGAGRHGTAQASRETA